jgi:rhomboid family GlyGly-CTERM serine protease
VTRGLLHRLRHGGPALPWRTLLLCAIAGAVFLALDPAPEAWVYDRAAILQGEWWRLLTGHWVHSDSAHAGWNIAALLACGLIFERGLRWRLPLALLLATVGVDAWLWWGEPGLQRYCGLSGILNGVIALGLVQLWRDVRHPAVMFAACGVAAKIIVETALGQAVFTQTAWPSVPETHAVGFLCGLLCTGFSIGTLRRMAEAGGAPGTDAGRHVAQC